MMLIKIGGGEEINTAAAIKGLMETVTAVYGEGGNRLRGRAQASF